MTRIGDDQVKVSFEKVVDRLPVDAGRSHRHGCKAGAFQPVAQFDQTLSHRRKGLDLFVRQDPWLARQQTSDGGGLINVQTASARDDHFYSHPLCLERSRRCRSANDTAVPPFPLGVRRMVAPLAARINLSCGVKPPKGFATSLRPLVTSHRRHVLTRLGYSPAGHDSMFFIRGGAPRE